ncbi:MAG: type II/IV secretion system ATPase subunit [Candidatus Nitrosocaldus sp.]
MASLFKDGNDKDKDKDKDEVEIRDEDISLEDILYGHGYDGSDDESMMMESARYESERKSKDEKGKGKGLLKKKEEEVITRPITSTPVKFKDVVEQYPILEPLASVTIAKDDLDMPIYIVNEPILTDEEAYAYSRLMSALQYELQLPYDSNVDPRDYFVDHAKRIITKYALSMGITPNLTWNKVYYYVTRDMIGFGPIDVMMNDTNIEDVSIDGVNKWVYVWHKKYENVRTNLILRTERELDDTIIRLVHIAGKHISTAYPIVDATLPGKHRLVATFRKEVSPHGSSLTIRKFREDPFTVIDLLNFKTLNPEIAAYTWLLMEHKISSIIVGATAAGKTTLLNAVISMIRPTAKIVTIEEVHEINIYHQNWVPLISRLGYGVGSEKVGEVTLFDLVKASMRMRPDFLIVGEVRGEEAYVLFQAISTGHGGLCTLHADDVESAIQRLTSKPMNVAPMQIKFLDLLFTIRNTFITDPDSKKTIRRRRVMAVHEIVDYNKYNKVFEWDPVNDTHVIACDTLKNSEKLKIISRDTGRTMDDLIEDIKAREMVLRWLQKKGIRNFKQVGRVFEQYHERRGEIYARIVSEIKPSV